MNREKNSFLGKRIGVMILDHIIFSFALTILALLIFIIIYFSIEKPIEQPYSIWLFIGPLIIFFILFSFYLNKDAIQGKSPAKRIIGLIIINNKSGEIANPIRLVLRNFTLILWPIEVIFSFFSPYRRIGDYIAGTKVILDDKTLQNRLNYLHLTVAFIIGIIFSSLIVSLQLLIQGLSIFDISFG